MRAIRVILAFITDWHSSLYLAFTRFLKSSLQPTIIFSCFSLMLQSSWRWMFRLMIPSWLSLLFLQNCQLFTITIFFFKYCFLICSETSENWVKLVRDLVLLNCNCLVRMLSSFDAIKLERFSISLFRSCDINVALLTGFSSSLALSFWLDDLEDPFLYWYTPSLFTFLTALICKKLSWNKQSKNKVKNCHFAMT